MGVKRYLLDTGIMSDFINHRKGVDVKAREARQRGTRIGTCMPIVGELFFGIEASATRDANLPKLKRALSGIICWPFDQAAAGESGRLAAELKRLGRAHAANRHPDRGDCPEPQQLHRGERRQ